MGFQAVTHQSEHELILEAMSARQYESLFRAATAPMKGASSDLRSVKNKDFDDYDKNPVYSYSVKELNSRGLAQLDLCLVRANRDHIQPYVARWREQNAPLLASFVRAPARDELLIALQAEEADGDDLPSHNSNRSRLPLYWTATFSLCDITWKQGRQGKARIANVSDSANWKCDRQPAYVVAQGCPHGTTVSIQCPQQQPDDNDVAMVSEITYQNITYRVRAHAECEAQHFLPEVPPNQPKHVKKQDAHLRPYFKNSTADTITPTTIVGSILFYRVPLTIMLEWMEYHRSVMSVDHFWVYVMQDFEVVDGRTSDANDSSTATNSTASLVLPDLDYITYIPWNLSPSMVSQWDRFLFQTAAQVDTLHRARRLQIQDFSRSQWWIMYNDLDEFMVFRSSNQNGKATTNGKGSKTRMTLKKYLTGDDREGRNIAEHHDAVQIETVTCGERTKWPGPPKTHPPIQFQLNFTWRSAVTYRTQRSKALVQPSRVDYYSIHWVTSPENHLYWADATNELWIHHYKSPNKFGVFQKNLKGKDRSGLVQDTELRDRYAGAVQQRVQEILASLNRTKLESE